MVSKTQQQSSGTANQSQLQDFFAQAEEALDNFEQDLIKLETLACPDEPTVKRLLKTLDTLKDETQPFALPGISAYVNNSAELLQGIHQGALNLSTEMMNNLFRMSDGFKDSLKRYQNGDYAPASTPQEPAPVVVPAPVPTPPVIQQSVAPAPIAAVIELPAPAPVAQPAKLAAKVTHAHNNLVIQVTGQNLPADALTRAVFEVDAQAQNGAFTITIPLAPTTLPVLAFTVAGNLLSVPVTHVQEVQRLNPADIHTEGSSKFITLRGQQIPLFDAAQLTADTSHASGPYMVILTDGALRLALVVDRLVGQETVAINPQATKNAHPAITGATSHNAGQSGLLIDATHLLHHFSAYQAGHHGH